MDVNSLLNDDGGGLNQTDRRAAQPAARPPPLPSLNTQTSFEYQAPPSPNLQQYQRPNSHRQSLPSAVPPGNFFGPVAQPGPPASPHGQFPVTPMSAHSLPPGRHHSLSSTPSSSYAQTPHAQNGSPSSTRIYPPQNTLHPTYQQPFSHSPSHYPTSRPRPPTQDLMNSVPPQIPHPVSRSSSTVSYPPSQYHKASVHLSRNDSMADVPPLQQSVSHPHMSSHMGSGDDDAMHLQRSRHESLSVSPKTAMSTLPQDTAIENPRHASHSSSTFLEDRVSRASPHSPTSSQRTSPQETSMRYPAVHTVEDTYTRSYSHLPATSQDHMSPQASFHRQRSRSSQLEPLGAIAPETRSYTPSAKSQDERAVGDHRSASIDQAKPKANNQSVPNKRLKSQSPSRSTTATLEPVRERRKIRPPPIWATQAKNHMPLKKVARETQPIVEAWEPCFTNVIPHEEVTRTVMDFLFLHVVSNDTFGASKPGTEASVDGQLEIEAKIGTLSAPGGYGQRLQLPVQTETVLHENFDVTFESLMTESQHRAFNEFLNGALAKSHEPARKVSMKYTHRYEKDTFYELPANELSALPAPVQSILKLRPKHRPKVRVTTDQKTGNVLAKIIKARIQDLHVYCPRSAFDWRISINVEMTWDGDVDALMQEAANESRLSNSPPRHKDRISYRHLYSQIDLTQVKSGSPDGPSHELEVELDPEEVKTQGKLISEGKPNRYEDLVKSFVDNVRTLARFMPQ